MWPIFIFISFDSLESVAGLAILVSVMALFFSYFAGHIKQAQREKVIIIGALLLALVWISRVFVSHPVFLYGTVVATALFILMIKIPLEANIFRRGHDHAPLSSSMHKNNIGMGVKGLFYAALLFFGVSFTGIFIIIAVALIGVCLTNVFYLQWRKKHNLPLTAAEGRTTEGMQPVSE